MKMHTGWKALFLGVRRGAAEGALKVSRTIPVLIARATKPYIRHTFFWYVVKIVGLCRISAVLRETAAIQRR